LGRVSELDKVLSYENSLLDPESQPRQTHTPGSSLYHISLQQELQTFQDASEFCPVSMTVNKNPTQIIKSNLNQLKFKNYTNNEHFSMFIEKFDSVKLSY